MSFSIIIWPSIIAAVLFMPYGAFLYSTRGLGKQWLNAIGKTLEDIQDEDSNMGLLMGSTFLLSILTVLIVDVLVASIGISTLGGLAVLVGLLFLLILAIRLKNSLFDGNMQLLKVNIIGTLGEFIITFVVFSFFIG